MDKLWYIHMIGYLLSSKNEWTVDMLERWINHKISMLSEISPGTGEPGGLPSMGSHRVGHDWSDLAAVAAVN